LRVRGEKDRRKGPLMPYYVSAPGPKRKLSMRDPTASKPAKLRVHDAKEKETKRKIGYRSTCEVNEVRSCDRGVDSPWEHDKREGTLLKIR